MASSTAFIVNPHAGRRKNIKKDIRKLRDILSSCGSSVEVFETRKPGHAIDIAHSCTQKKFDRLIVGGGDGTFNEVLSGLSHFRTPVGFIPLGTTNVLAQEFGIPSDPFKAAQVILEGHITIVDVGIANKRRFLLWCGVGLDAYVISKVPLPLKKLIGPLAYEFTAFREILFYKPPKLRVRMDDGAVHEGYFVVVSNAKLYGGRLLSPAADIADGLLDVVILRRPDILHFLQNWWGVSKDKPPQFQNVGVFKTHRLSIETNENAAGQVDGEIFGHTPISISLQPSALQLFTAKS